MAETFLATRLKDNGPGFRVALKQVLPELLGHSPGMREEFLERFAREARIGATLDHPNIVRVVDSGVLDGRPYMAMQLIEGCSLAALIKSCAEATTPLPPTVLMHIACDLAAALEYAHRHDVLHRDVSPGNVLLSDAGQCRLSDFGVARLVTEDLGLTRTQAFMGKVPYVAPEVFHGMADELSDAYSLGVTLTEAAIGRRLFPSSTVHESMAARVQTDVYQLLLDTRRDLPERFRRVAYRAHKPRPKRSSKRRRSAHPIRTDGRKHDEHGGASARGACEDDEQDGRRSAECAHRGPQQWKRSVFG